MREAAASPLPPGIPTDLPLTWTPGVPAGSAPAMVETPSATAIQASVGDAPLPAGSTPRPGGSVLPASTTGEFTSTPTASPVASFEPTAQPPAVVAAETQQGPGSSAEYELSSGVYRVLFRSDTASTVRVSVLEGVCNEVVLFETSGPFDGSATYRSTGCRVRFDVSGSPNMWTLVVETASHTGMVTLPAALQGEGPEAAPLIAFPEGVYRIIFTTTSQYSMVVPIVVRGPCLERPIFLLTQPGQYEETYTSYGCEIVFEISSVTGAWELRIERGD